MNCLAKYLLCATSLAPMLGAFAIRAYTKGDHQTCWILTFVTAASVFICYLVLKFAEKDAGSESMETVGVKSADKDVLAFLITYMLPLFGDQAFVLGSNPWVVGYMLVILFTAVAHSNSYHFNPFISLLFGYHFYEVELDKGTPSILISRRELALRKANLRVVKLSNHLYIDVTPPKQD